jgi:biopolymer transport protein TolR
MSTAGPPQGAKAPLGGRKTPNVEASFGRLERSHSSKPISDINMTPLIDVMLVLLVIFIITAPLLVSSVQLELPRAAAAGASDAPQFVELAIDRTGAVWVDGTAQTTENLNRLLEKTAKANAKAEVRLRADTRVPYGRVVEVMGQVQKPA